ncbi:MAG TPA: DUF1697 domain-containing protein [Flavobacterium sp.]|nr:DUF1697 domain-containing protein [Flavobacterium sp.]
MKTYIALLRGINVSGHKLIKMEKLREVLKELELEHISTYIQSGNVLFQSKISGSKKLEKMISDLIYKHFGFDVAVIVLTPEELKTTVKNNPFSKENIELPQPYIAFLSTIPVFSDIEVLKATDFQNDRFVVMDNKMYLHYADGAGSTKLSNAIIEKKLKLTSTARNWKTVLKLIELSEAMHK